MIDPETYSEWASTSPVQSRPGGGTFELRLSTFMLVVDETRLRAGTQGLRDGSNLWHKRPKNEQNVDHVNKEDLDLPFVPWICLFTP